MTVDAPGVAARAGWAARISDRTPAHRDRTVDALRAVAIVGVVFGHWLVTSLVLNPDQPLTLSIASPLAHRPGLSPLSWFLQTLGPFFFAGGFAAARSYPGHDVVPWLGARLRRLLPPAVVLMAVWWAAMQLMSVVGTPEPTRQAVWALVTQPMWFLLVYLALTLLTPVLRPLVVRFGPWAVLPGVALVAVTDSLRSHGLPEWLALLTVVVAWAVPFLLGIAMAEGRLPRAAGAALLPLGVVGGAALVLVAKYPANAVGVPGDRFSNLSPPSLFALALVAAQLGLFLLLRPRLARWLERPAVWAPTVVLNLVAMTVYCWHQTALLLVSFGGLVIGRPAGLLDEPTGAWPLHRLLWLPVLLLVLAGLTWLFHRVERR